MSAPPADRTGIDTPAADPLPTLDGFVDAPRFVIVEREDLLEIVERFRFTGTPAYRVIATCEREASATPLRQAERIIEGLTAIAAT